MSPRGSGFFFLRDTLTPILGAIDIEAEAEHELDDMASEVQDYAQATAPWADRTGAARAGLTAEVTREGTDVVLSLYHTVDYGIWLETIQAGRYAVIMPTLEHFTREAMDRCHAQESGGDFLE